MQRFRLLDVYLAGMLLVFAGAISGMAWLARPPDTTAVSVDAAPAPQPSTAPAPHPSTTQVEVQISDFTFVPKDLSVAVGTTVTWINRDDVPHTVTRSSGPAAFDSKALDTDDRFSFTFTTAGTYRYYCKAHPHMTATVVVK